MLGNGGTMLFRGIALIAVPSVAGKLFVQAVHVVVAVGLGQDGRGGDGKVLAVALHHRGVGNVGIFLETVAVDEQVLRTDGELVDGAVHGQERGVEDVDFVDFLRRDDAHGPRQGLPLDDLAQSVSLVLGQLLGVVQQFVAEILRQDDGGGIDGARQTAATGLVAPGLGQIGIQIGK